MTTTKRATCKGCGSSEHIVHCHHTGAELVASASGVKHYKTCPVAQAHAHPYESGDHKHE